MKLGRWKVRRKENLSLSIKGRSNGGPGVLVTQSPHPVPTEFT